MEHTLRHEQDPVDSLGGPLSPHREVPKAAGHILLHDSPHNGEIKLGTDPQQSATSGPAFRPVAPIRNEQFPSNAELPPAASHLGAVAASAEQQPSRVERSAWHTIGVDGQGNALPQEYGQGFHQERRAELVAQQVADTAAVFGQNTPTQPASAAVSQAAPTTPQLSDPMDPSQSTAFGDVEMPTAVPVPKAQVPANPLYSVMPGTRASTPPAVAQAEPAEQQLSSLPMGGPQQPPVPMTGAVNPSFAQPTLPHNPQLTAGKQVDVQHRLPMHQSTLKKLLMSPWVWLAVGVAMIWYFSSGLFN